MTRPLFILCFAFIIACNSETSINQDDASDVIKTYLASNPEFKTTTFKYGELKFRSRKDKDLLNKYKTLEDKGMITMKLDEKKKVFLSTDTTFVYQVTLTEAASPLVLEQGKGRATVKALNYILDDAKPVNFVKANNRTAKATVSLKKEATEFYPFLSRDSHSEFITKTYKLKLKKDNGWVVE